MGSTGGETVRRRRTPEQDRVVSALAPGGRIGRYLPLDEVGRGGMGVVVRAYDPTLQREVALKTIRGDPGHHGHKSRLLAEARAMAKLSHPNVVEVFDVLELDDAVVIAMQYVPGPTLEKWIRSRRSWREVVDVFVGAGQGLEAAHGAGLLHRDFKPANVLLEPELRRPRVTDFGLALHPQGEAITSALASSTAHRSQTRSGGVMGTPHYMAPEQHAGRSLTEAADQYAYCVSLWRALTGEFPFDGTPSELAKRKHEGPPLRPTDRAVPRRVFEALRRGLATRPSERFGSMSELLGALTSASRRRRRAWTSVLGLVGLVGLASAAAAAQGGQAEESCTGARAQLAAAWDAPARTRVRRGLLATGTSYAEGTASTVDATLDAYADDWLAGHTDACEAATIRAEQSPEVLDLRMACLQRARVELSAAVDILAEADTKTVERARKVVDGLPPLTRCRDVAALTADVPPPRPEEAEAVADIEAFVSRSKAARNAGRYGRARQNVQQAQAALASVSYGPAQTLVYRELAAVKQKLGAYEEAASAYTKALRSGLRHGQLQHVRLATTGLIYVRAFRQRRLTVGRAYRPLLRGAALRSGSALAMADYRSSNSDLSYLAGRYDEAEIEAKAALDLLEAELPATHPRVARFRNNYANVLYAQGKYPQARVAYEAALESAKRAFDPRHPYVAMYRGNLASVLAGEGDYEGAERELREVLELRLEAYGPEHPVVANTRHNLANTLASQGKLDEAETSYRQALEGLTRKFGPEHQQVADTRNSLGNVFRRQKRYAEAELEYRDVLAIYDKLFGPGHPDSARVHDNLGGALRGQGRYAAAEQELQTGIALMQRATPKHPELVRLLDNLGLLYEEQGRLDEAVEAFRSAEELGREVLGDEHPTVVDVRGHLEATLGSRR